MKKLGLAFALCALLAAGAAAAGSVWVTSSGAKIVAEPTATGKVVSSPAVGSELPVLATKDKWYQVTAPGGAKGWIYRGKVSTTRPASQSGGLFGAAGKSSIEVSSADTARSIRGLSPEAAQYADGVNAPADTRKAVDQVLAWKTTPAEVDEFLKKGRVGEYAE